MHVIYKHMLAIYTHTPYCATSVCLTDSWLSAPAYLPICLIYLSPLYDTGGFYTHYTNVTTKKLKLSSTQLTNTKKIKKMPLLTTRSPFGQQLPVEIRPQQSRSPCGVKSQSFLVVAREPAHCKNRHTGESY